MACNSDDRRQWRKQGEAVGAAASRMQGPPKYNARVFDSRQNAGKMFVKLVIMNIFRKFCKQLDIKAVLCFV